MGKQYSSIYYNCIKYSHQGFQRKWVGSQYSSDTIITRLPQSQRLHQQVYFWVCDYPDKLSIIPLHTMSNTSLFPVGGYFWHFIWRGHGSVISITEDPVQNNSINIHIFMYSTIKMTENEENNSWPQFSQSASNQCLMWHH